MGKEYWTTEDGRVFSTPFAEKWSGRLGVSGPFQTYAEAVAAFDRQQMITSARLRRWRKNEPKTRQAKKALAEMI